MFLFIFNQIIKKKDKGLVILLHTKLQIPFSKKKIKKNSTPPLTALIIKVVIVLHGL